jgi:hypothetical protein
VNLRHYLMLTTMVGITISGPATAQKIGPSTTTEPYVLPVTAGVSTIAILTAGDSIGGYRMVGIPDGAGAWKESSTTFNVVVNHELGEGKGVPRAHGSAGAFVSRWVIESTTGKVLSGRDHLTGPTDVKTWDGTKFVAGTTAFNRLCSADLASKNAYFLDGLAGTAHRIFLSGEETSPPSSADHGRLFAHILTGQEKNTSYELPRLGKMAFENALASPFRQLKTIVMLNDDANRETSITSDNVCRASPGATGCKEPPSELAVYIGTKQNHGNTIDRAGLTNGNFYGVRVKVNDVVVTGENKEFVLGTAAPAINSARFELVNLGDVAGKTGVEIQDELLDSQAMQFIRIEDGAWDPRPGKERDYYFVTTGRLDKDASKWLPSRLWRVSFDDIAQPENGGTITMLLTNQFFSGADTTPDLDPDYQMLDNMTIDRLGRIVLQEDVGNNKRLGRIYVYGIDSGKLVQVAAHNSKFFGGNATTNPSFLTSDEESSGIIDISHIVGDGWFALSVQNHRASSDPELVEGGQFVGLYIHPTIGQ